MIALRQKPVTSMTATAAGRGLGSILTRGRLWLGAALAIGMLGIMGGEIIELSGAELPDLESAAQRLIGGVVTVRVPVPGTEDRGARVVVCSGAIVGPSWVVTPVFAGADSRVKITLPQGRQVEGTIRVLDEYSGLALVGLADEVEGALPLAEDLPAVGAWVLSAAGWGAEKPVVSLGIVSGHDRTDPGLAYPPLLQCDMRAARTSSGAAVVNRKGAMVGVVVVTGTDQATGFTFAVPVDHVRRLLRIARERRNVQGIVVLKRRRPEVGMVLDGQQGEVRVARVTAGSPADRAGIQVGDRVLAVNGVHIRSVYQAIRPVLIRQPGDRVVFTLERGGEQREVAVVLGGGVEVPRGRWNDIAQFVRPKIEWKQVDVARGIRARRKVDPAVAASSPDSDTEVARRQALLEKSLERYQAALKALQERLQKSEAERKELQRQVRELQAEVKRKHDR